MPILNRLAILEALHWWPGHADQPLHRATCHGRLLHHVRQVLPDGGAEGRNRQDGKGLLYLHPPGCGQGDGTAVDQAEELWNGGLGQGAPENSCSMVVM